MSVPLRVLIVEDWEDDALLVLRELRRGGYDPSFEQVDNAEAMGAALDRQRWDVVIADYSMPHLSAFAALRLAQARDPDLPFLIVSGSIGEATAVEAMRAGAHDYIMKDNLTRLLPAIERELREAVIRRTRRQAEQALQESEERFRATFEQAAVGMAHVGLDGRWLRVNQRLCEILGYSRAELLARSFQEITHPDDLAADLQHARRLLADEVRTYTVEKRFVRPDGAVVWTNLTVSLVRGAAGDAGAGQPQYFIGVAEDISRRKRLEEELRQRVDELAERDRRKDEFLAMLAHELRNPLGAVSNAVQLLQRLSPEEPRLCRAVETIARQVQHQARLVDDLLDVARLTRGKVSLEPESLDLVRLLRHAALDHQPAFERAALTLALELPEEPVWVTADRTRLTQVMENLLTNALKFTPAGGTVGVRCSVLGVGTDAEHRTPSAVVSVRDTGVGIEPAMLPRIFESFAQADRSLDRSQGGLGLGLTLVHGLIALHGGEVWAASPGLGGGAEFCFRLPLLRRDEGRGMRDESDAGPSSSRIPHSSSLPSSSLISHPSSLSDPSSLAPERGLRVLVVDDNRDAAETLRDLLELFGHEAQIAFSGPEAILAVRRLRPEVVLCDIGLPGMDGYAVAERLRGDPQTADARLVALTGYAGEEAQGRALAAGFVHHLAKPVDLAKLEAALQSALPRCG